MKVKTPQIGGVCVSLQGRDKGRVLVILGIEDGRAAVADGVTRKAATPKKKNLKHLKLLPVRLDWVEQNLSAGKPVYDNQISYALRQLAESGEISEENECQKAT